MSGPAIELMDVRKEYGRLTALDGLDLAIGAGEVLGLLGHNGAGKTTAIKLILGIIAPTSGRVRALAGSPCGPDARRLRLQMGYLPESVSFYGQLSGREVLTYFAGLKGVAAQECMALLERVGLVHAADRRVSTYSKGMRQRLGLAQALLGRPRLLLLDEPTVGLDPLATREFFAVVDELRQRGTTVVLCSHVLSGMEPHIDRAAILGRGRLLAAGTLEELRRETGLPVVIRVRGEWPQGFWEPRLRAQGIEEYHVNGHRLELHIPQDRKMEVTRTLLADGSVHDIELRPPSLDSLYAYYGDRETEFACAKP